MYRRLWLESNKVRIRIRTHANIMIRYYGKMDRFGKFILANISLKYSVCIIALLSAKYLI